MDERFDSRFAAAAYEFRMQTHWPAAWIATSVGAALALAATLKAEHDPGFASAGHVAAFMIGNLPLIPVV